MRGPVEFGSPCAYSEFFYSVYGSGIELFSLNRYVMVRYGLAIPQLQVPIRYNDASGLWRVSVDSNGMRILVMG